MNGADVLVQSEPQLRCRGFRGIGVTQPVRMLVRSGTAAATTIADRLAAALRVAVGGLGDEIAPTELPCLGHLHTPCLAEDEPQTRNVLVWVGGDDDPDPAQDARVAEWLRASAAAFAVAVVPEGRNPDDAVPAPMRDRQLVWWNGDDDRAAHDVLAAAGVVSPDRRIFVSYSHSDGVELANAVFHTLSEARFSVFLDAFALAPGGDFAERIEHELLDKAFLLLIETPGAIASSWVLRELAFARRHRLGIGSVHPAGGRPLAGIGRARRWEVPPGALTTGGNGGPALEPAAAAELSAMVVRLHGEALTRRRRALDGGLRAALRSVGVARSDILGVPGGLDVNAAGRRWPVALSPRPATVVDMHTAARRTPASQRGVVVSATPGGRPERDALAWLGGATPIRHWDEGRLLSLARALISGSL